MGWQRFNRTTNVFEVSDDNGGSWQVLKIAAAGLDVVALPPNIAYTNVVNNFTARQKITGGLGDNYDGASLEIQAGKPRISFHWPAVVASQIGVGSDGAIRTYDNPGTGYAPFQSGILQTTGEIYPGHNGNGGIQGSWAISGHGSFGLYINTGLYVVGNVWCAGLIPRGPITPRIIQVAGTSTYIAPNENLYDIIAIWDLAQTLTIGAGGGSIDGFPWILRVRDNGAARALSWDGNYMSACGVPLPTQTAPSRSLYMGFRWNAYYGRWHMISIAQE